MIKRSVLNYLLVLVVGLSSTVSALANYNAGHAYFARGDYVTAASQYFNAYTAPKIGLRKERQNGDWLRVFKGLGLLYSASKFYSIIVSRGEDQIIHSSEMH